MNYLKLLEDSYKTAVECFECAPESKFEYLGDYIFDFTTYDDEISSLFAQKAIEVCAAINNRTTFQYIEDKENYKWYLLMCNMPFFVNKLEWGTSIRGAWWGGRPGKQIEFTSCGLFMEDEQLTKKMKFTREEWEVFIKSLIEFSNEAKDLQSLQV